MCISYITAITGIHTILTWDDTDLHLLESEHIFQKSDIMLTT
jgi:hypothetical protein